MLTFFKIILTYASITKNRKNRHYILNYQHLMLVCHLTFPRDNVFVYNL